MEFSRFSAAAATVRDCSRHQILVASASGHSNYCKAELGIAS